MPDDNIVVGTNAVPVSATIASKIRVTNGGGATLYFKDEANVSDSDNDGSLAAGASETFTAPTWFISTAQRTRMFVERIPSASTDMATQAELDAAILGVESEITNELTINPPSGEKPLVLKRNGAQFIEFQDISATADKQAPTIQFHGTNGGWGMGLDVAAPTKYRDFAIFKRDFPNPGDVNDFLYLRHNGENKPDLRIGGTYEPRTETVVIRAPAALEDPDPEVGALRLQAGYEETAPIFTLEDYGGTDRLWVDVSQPAVYSLRIRGDGTGKPAFLVQDSEAKALVEMQANGTIRFNEDNNAAISRPEAGVIRFANSIRTLGAIQLTDSNTVITRTAAGEMRLGNNVKILSNIGFFNTTPVAKKTVTGSRGGNAALASLLTALSEYGLVTNSTEA